MALEAQALGERIRRLREQRGWSASELARLADVPQPTVSRIERGRFSSPRAKGLARIAQVLGVPLDVLLGTASEGSAPHGSTRPNGGLLPELTGVLLVPMISEVSAGGGFSATGYVQVPPIQGASLNLAAFRIRGECMAPRIEPGDVVIVDLAREWRDGNVVLARVDDALMVKRVFRVDGRIVLRADADGYDDVAEDSIVVLGVVLSLMKRIG